MSEHEKENVIIKLRNQILGIVVVAALSGLGFNFIFITTINSRVTDVTTAQQKTADKLDAHLNQLITINK